MSTKKSTTEKKVDDRTRNFTALLYPDCVNTPENWLQILGELQIPMFISPLHDKDVTISGEPKKPHYHIILMFEGKKSIEQAKEIFSLVGAVPPPEIQGKSSIKVQSIRGAARYLCHLDNPDKALYDVDNVVSFGGADYSAIIGLAIDKYKAIDEIMDYCDENGVYSYRDLLQYCRKQKRDWFRVLCDNGSYVVLEYLKSASWSDKDIKVNTETGEIID